MSFSDQNMAGLQNWFKILSEIFGVHCKNYKKIIFSTTKGKCSTGEIDMNLKVSSCGVD